MRTTTTTITTTTTTTTTMRQLLDRCEHQGTLTEDTAGTVRSPAALAIHEPEIVRSATAGAIRREIATARTLSGRTVAERANHAFAKRRLGIRTDLRNSLTYSSGVSV